MRVLAFAVCRFTTLGCIYAAMLMQCDSCDKGADAAAAAALAAAASGQSLVVPDAILPQDAPSCTLDKFDAECL